MQKRQTHASPLFAIIVAVAFYGAAFFAYKAYGGELQMDMHGVAGSGVCTGSAL